MSTKFTAVVTSSTVPGGSYLRGATLTGPTSYTTGGIPLTPDLFNLHILENVDINYCGNTSGSPATTSCLYAQWNNVKKTIQLFYVNAAGSPPTLGEFTEVAAAFNASGVTIKVVATGR